jgi:hypothetical protein
LIRASIRGARWRQQLLSRTRQVAFCSLLQRSALHIAPSGEETVSMEEEAEFHLMNIKRTMLHFKIHNPTQENECNLMPG